MKLHYLLAAMVAGVAGGNLMAQPPALEQPSCTYQPAFIKGLKGQAARLNYFDHDYGQAYLERSLYFPNAPAPFLSGKQGSLVINFNHLMDKMFSWDALFDAASGFTQDSSDGMLKKSSRLQLFIYPPAAQDGKSANLNDYRQGRLACIAELPEGNFDIQGPFLDHHQWYQAVVVWGDRKLSLYVNGKLAGCRDLPSDLELELANRVWLGANLGASCAFQGAIDEVMIFNRALTANEVVNLQRGQEFSRDPGLVFYLPCNGSLAAKITRQPPGGYAQEHIVFAADLGQWGYRPRGPLKMKLSLPPGTAAGYRGTVRLTETFSGREIFKQACALRPATDFTAELATCGVFTLEVTVQDPAGKSVFERRTDFGVTVPVPPLKELPDSYPVAGHSGSQKSQDGGYAPNLGFKWNRIWYSNYWAELNPTPGVYYWQYLDRTVAELQANGNKILLCVFGPPSWASSAPDRAERVSRLARFGGVPAPVAELEGNKLVFTAATSDLAAFETFLRELFRRYKGKIDAYELWNEPGSPFFGTATNYVQMLAVMNKVRDEADPAALIVSGVGCPGYIEWDRQLIAAGIAPYLQILSVHDYNYASPLQWYAGQQIATAKREMAAAVNRPVRVWGTENGFMFLNRRNGEKPLSHADFLQKYGQEYTPDVIAIVNEETNAKWEMQAVFTSLLGGLEKVFFHGSAWMGAPNHKGVAFAALTQVLGKYRAIREFDPGVAGALGALIENTDGTYNAALFAAQDTVALYPSTRPVRAMDYLGNAFTLNPHNGVICVTLGAAPVYLFDISPRISGKRLARVEMPAKLLPNTPARCQLMVTNPFAGETTFALSAASPKNWQVHLPKAVTLKAGETKAVPFSLRVPADAVRGDYPVDVSLAGPDGLVYVLRENARTAGRLLTLPELTGTVDLSPAGGPLPGMALTAPLATLAQVKIGQPNPMFPNETAHWTGPADLSATLRAGWTPDGIYLEITVTDDVLRPAPKDEAEPFNYDGLELFVDFRRPERVSGRREATEQIFISPALTSQLTPCRTVYPNGGKSVTALFWGRKTSTGYLIQGKLTPRGESALALRAGAEIGLDLALDDCDDPKAARRRKSQLVWLGEQDNYAKPDNWGRFKLSAAGNP